MIKMDERRLQNLVMVIATLTAILWGGSSIAAKFALLHGMHPYWVGIIRTAVSGLLVLPLIIYTRAPLPTTKRQFRLLIISAFGGFIGFPLIFSYGQDLTSASHAAMILAFQPLMTAGISLLVDGRRPQSHFIAGAVIALIGEIILIFVSSNLHSAKNESDFLGNSLVFIAAALACGGYVAGARLQQTGYPAISVTFWGLALSTPVMALFIPLALMHQSPANFTGASIAGAVYLVFISSIAGYIMWYWALGHGGITRMGLIQFIQPLTGVILATLIIGDSLSLCQVLAALLILGGLIIALHRPAAKPAAEPAN